MLSGITSVYVRIDMTYPPPSAASSPNLARRRRVPDHQIGPEQLDQADMSRGGDEPRVESMRTRGRNAGSRATGQAAVLHRLSDRREHPGPLPYPFDHTREGTT